MRNHVLSRINIAVILVSRKTGKVAAVKNLVCYFLIVWLTLVAGGVIAQATKDSPNQASHTHDHTLQATKKQAIAFEFTATLEVNHADVCSQSHCGHGHATGLLAPHGVCVITEALSAIPKTRTSWVSNPRTTDIERPKWLSTTYAVVNLLS